MSKKIYFYAMCVNFYVLYTFYVYKFSMFWLIAFLKNLQNPKEMFFPAKISILRCFYRLRVPFLSLNIFYHIFRNSLWKLFDQQKSNESFFKNILQRCNNSLKLRFNLWYGYIQRNQSDCPHDVKWRQFTSDDARFYFWHFLIFLMKFAVFFNILLLQGTLAITSVDIASSSI